MMLRNASLKYDVQNMLHTPVIPNTQLMQKKKKCCTHLWYPKVHHAPI